MYQDHQDQVETGIEPIFFDLQSNTSPFCHPTSSRNLEKFLTLSSQDLPLSPSLLIVSFHILNVMTIAFQPLPNPKLLVPLYIEHLADLVPVLLESTPLNVHAIRALLPQEYRLSLSFPSPFALTSPIVVQNSAFSEPFDKLFYIHLVFVVRLSMPFFAFFDAVTPVHFVLFVVLLPFLFLLSFSSLFIGFLLFLPLDQRLAIFVDPLVAVLLLQRFVLSRSRQLTQPSPPTKPSRLQLHRSFHLYTKFVQML
jgi:hypothetical protein